LSARQGCGNYGSGTMEFSEREIKELLKAWAAISLAFAIAMGGVNSFSLKLLTLSGLTVGIGFLLHELGHKFVAQTYGYPAEFRSFDTMLLLAVLLSFSGFVFAAPGAVFIGLMPTLEENGKISAAGPLASLGIALIFLLLQTLVGPSLLFSYGFQINSWLAFFNLLPILNLDGSKILAWNKGVYALLVLTAFFFSFVI
jgi:Zn-dependent protease